MENIKEKEVRPNSPYTNNCFRLGNFVSPMSMNKYAEKAKNPNTETGMPNNSEYLLVFTLQQLPIPWMHKFGLFENLIIAR